MQSRAARVGRGTAAAVFATLAATVSHALAGGDVPSAFALAVALVISIAICTLLAGRTVSFMRLAVAVAASQSLFHGLFVGLGTPMPVAHDHVFVATDHSHGTMWAAHAAAAAVTVVVLRYAETAFWSVAEGARLFVARLVGRSILVPLPSRVPVVPRRRTLTLFDIELAATRHRGPPVAHCA